MSVLIGRRRLFVASLAAATVLLVLAASAMASEVVYSNVPATLAGNYASVGAEAYSYGEFGTQVELGGTARNNPQVEVVMSAWACQFGTWFNHTCETPSTKKFKWPLTLKMYEVGEQNQVGEQLGEVTKSFSMPYRPSEDHVHCPEGGQWYDATTATCFHGLAFAVKFPTVKVKRLPKRVILGISYDTSHYGPAPVGEHNECNAKSSGCYYDALNVGLAEPSENLLTKGANPTEPYIEILQAGAAEETCGNTADVGKFVPSECHAFWEGDQPLFQITTH